MKNAVVLAWFAFLAGSVSLFAAEKKVPRYEGKPLEYWVDRLQKAENDKDRGEAGKALMAFGPDAAPAIPDLLEMLEDHSESYRSTVLGILKEIGPASKTAVPTVVRRLKNKTARHPEAVVEFLSYLGPEAQAAVPVLIELLKDKHLQRDAARVLGKIGPRAAAAVPALLSAFKENEAHDFRSCDFRSCIIDYLEEIGAPPDQALIMVKVLKDGGLKDNDPFNRIKAAKMLWKVGQDPDGIKVLAKLLNFIREDVKRTLYVADSDDTVCYVMCKSAEALGDIGPPAKEALPELKKRLTHYNGDVRKAALEAIRKIDPEEGRKLKIDADGTVTMEGVGKIAPGLPAPRGGWNAQPSSATPAETYKP